MDEPVPYRLTISVLGKDSYYADIGGQTGKQFLVSLAYLRSLWKRAKEVNRIIGQTAGGERLGGRISSCRTQN
jgi:hypothetical protein